MSHTGLPHDALLYPCSDGQPMAETDLHAASMVYVASALRWWFEKHRQADVYVGSNNFLYYERGNPGAVVAPDVYVVIGASAHLRDTYLLWNEPKGPDFVLEVTSKSTRGTDEQRKREVYASLGVSEYFLYDPRAEYLAPPLQGFRLHEGEYRSLPAVTVLSDRGVAVTSGVLGLELRDEREARRVRLRDPSTGESLLSHRESELAREEEAAARRAAEARIRELERALATTRKPAE
ncbi:MAG: Uma2 family endonuclease [Thiotrichales bacterium]|nr:Uma2 family endonuclease [Thiotrichales bacterium]